MSTYTINNFDIEIDKIISISGINFNDEDKYYFNINFGIGVYTRISKDNHDDLFKIYCELTKEWKDVIDITNVKIFEHTISNDVKIAILTTDINYYTVDRLKTAIGKYVEDKEYNEFINSNFDSNIRIVMKGINDLKFVEFKDQRL